MAKHSHRRKNKPSRIAQDQHPRSLKYYLSGKKYHINIGKFATKTYVQVMQLLTKEIPLPSLASISGVNKNRATAQPGQARVQDSKNKKLDTQDFDNDQDSVGIPNQPSKSISHKSTMEEIKKLTKRSNEVLCSVSTVWPFALFTDHVVLDRTKLTITKRDFFYSSQVMSIRIEDVLNVSADYGPFLGSVTVAIRIMNSDDHITISNLKRSDAVHLKHIIQGYVIAQHNNIDVAHLNKDELIETLTELGHDLNS